MRKLAERKKRALAMARALDKVFPDPRTRLRYGNPWELVVAVILSAQTTDEKVNEVTRKLFEKYRTLEDYARAKPAKLAKDIYPVSFFRTKAKNLVQAATIVKEEHGGRIPDTVEELTRLPGIGRKTANVVLGNLHGASEGIMVDTHVRRLARKFDLTDHDDPAKIEQDLMELLPESRWFAFGQQLVLYGQTLCSAREHDCDDHPLTRVWPPAARRWPRVA